MNYYAYALNSPVRFTDPTGLDVYYLNAPKRAKGFGHAAAIVGGHDGRYTYQSFQDEGYTESPYYNSFEEALAAALREYPDFKEYATYCTNDAAADEAAREKGREFKGTQYSLGNNHCDHMASGIVWAAGIAYHLQYGTPNKTFETIRKANTTTITRIQ